MDELLLLLLLLVGVAVLLAGELLLVWFAAGLELVVCVIEFTLLIDDEQEVDKQVVEEVSGE